MSKSLLFVCLGNICRSPAADGIMHHLVEMRGVDHLFYINSAGIGSWHVGQLPDSRMRKHGARRGYSFEHRAQQVRPEDFLRYDYIIGMDFENMSDLQRVANRCVTSANSHRAELLCLADFLHHHPGQQTVPDPYYGGDADFEFALDLIEDGCEGLLDWLLEQ